MLVSDLVITMCSYIHMSPPGRCDYSNEADNFITIIQTFILCIFLVKWNLMSSLMRGMILRAPVYKDWLYFLFYFCYRWDFNVSNGRLWHYSTTLYFVLLNAILTNFYKTPWKDLNFCDQSNKKVDFKQLNNLTHVYY